MEKDRAGLAQMTVHASHGLPHDAPFQGSMMSIAIASSTAKETTYSGKNAASREVQVQAQSSAFEATLASSALISFFSMAASLNSWSATASDFNCFRCSILF